MLHQKRNWLIGLWLLLWSSQMVLWAKPTPTNYQKLLKKTVKQINQQVLQNIQNDQQGKGQLNNYVIRVLDPAIKTQGYQFVQPSTLATLNQYLVRFNQKNTRQFKLYVTLIGHLPAIGFDVKQALGNQSNADQWTIQRVNQEQVLAIKTQANSEATKINRAQFVEDVYSKSLLNGRVGNRTAMFTVLSELYLWHPVKYNGQQSEPFSLENDPRAQVYYTKGFSYDETLQYICSKVLHPDRKQLNIRQGLKEFAPQGNIELKKLLHFSENADVALGNFLLFATACMDPSFVLSTAPNQLPGSTVLKNWLPPYLNAGQQHVVEDNQDEDYRHLSGINYSLCQFLQKRRLRDNRIRGRVEKNNGIVNLYAYASSDYNADYPLASIDRNQKLLIDQQAWIKASEAEVGNDGQPINLFALKTAPLTYVTRTKNGRLGFYTELGLAQLELAIQVVNRGVDHFLVRQLDKITINQSGTTTTTTQAPTYRGITLQTSFVDVVDNDITEQENRDLQNTLAELGIVTEDGNAEVKKTFKALIKTCQVCLTKEAVREKRVSKECIRKITSEYLRFELERDLFKKIDVPEVFKLPIQQGKHLSDLVQGAFRGDPKRAFTGFMALLQGTPFEKINTYYSFINNVAQGNYIGAFLDVLPEMASLKPIGFVLGLSALVIGGIKAYLYFRDPCRRESTLARRVACVFDPSLNVENALDVNIAQRIIDNNNQINVLKLIRKQKLVDEIKALNGIQDLRGNTIDGARDLLINFSRTNNLLVDLINNKGHLEQWRYLRTRTNSGSPRSRVNPLILSAVQNFRRKNGLNKLNGGGNWGGITPNSPRVWQADQFLGLYHDSRTLTPPVVSSYEDALQYLSILENCQPNVLIRLQERVNNIIVEWQTNPNNVRRTNLRGNDFQIEVAARIHNSNVLSPIVIGNRTISGNITSIEETITINNTSRDYDIVVQGNRFYIDTKNFARRSLTDFPNDALIEEVRRDILLFPSKRNQNKVIYIFKQRDIGGQQDLENLIFNILENQVNNRYLRAQRYRGSNYAQRLRSFISHKFVLIN